MKRTLAKTMLLCVLAFGLPCLAQAAPLRKTNPDLTVQ